MKNLKNSNMTTLSNTKENNIYIAALKTISQCKWSGNTSFDNLEKALVSANFQTNNSGDYIPTPIKLKGLKGIYLVNKDGSLHFETRILKEDENKYVIEYLTSSGYDEFEQYYSKLI